MSSQPNQNIIQYIYTYLHQGYALEDIKKGLLTQGYKQSEIDSAVDYLYAHYYYSQKNNEYQKPYAQKVEEIKKETKRGIPSVILLFIFILFGVVLIGFAFVFILSNPNNHTDNTKSLEEIVDLYPDSHSKTQYPHLEDKDETNQQVEDTNTKESNNQIKQPTQEETKNSNENNNFEEVPTTLQYDSTQTYTKRQLDLRVNDLSYSNPKEATKFCLEYDNEEDTSFCYIEIAKNSENAQYCEKITHSKYKDNCFFEMVLSGINNNVCDMIENEETKGNCKTIAQLNIELETIEQINPEEIVIEEQQINQSQYEEVAQQYAVAANFY